MVRPGEESLGMILSLGTYSNFLLVQPYNLGQCVAAIASQENPLAEDIGVITGPSTASTRTTRPMAGVPLTPATMRHWAISSIMGSGLSASRRYQSVPGKRLTTIGPT